ALLCAAAALVAAGGAGARRAAVGCGDTITADVTLTADVSGCAGDGLVVAADGGRVSVDGHVVSWSGAGGGLPISGANVSVGDGFVRAFDTGVRAGNGTQLAGLTVTGNRAGVLTFSQSGVLAGSTVAFNTGDGVTVAGASSWTIRDSQI